MAGRWALVAVLVLGVLALPASVDAGSDDSGGTIRVFYAAEPGSTNTDWYDDTRRALDEADELLPDGRTWRWGEIDRVHIVGNTWQDRAATAREYIGKIHAYERRLIVHEAGLGEHQCGRASQPIELTYDKVNTAHVGGDCLDGRTVTHELLHTLGAVHEDAPTNDGRVHSTSRGDIMSGSGTTIDVDGDSYWNIDPPPGSWLADNPMWNAAHSPFVD